MFRRASFSQRDWRLVETILRETGLDTNALNIEITESVLIRRKR